MKNFNKEYPSLRESLKDLGIVIPDNMHILNATSYVMTKQSIMKIKLKKLNDLAKLMRVEYRKEVERIKTRTN